MAERQRRRALLGWDDGPACGGPARREEVEGGFRAGDPGERVVDYIVAA
jgi:hypothetical protein